MAASSCVRISVVATVLLLVAVPSLAQPVDVQVLESGSRIVLEYSFGDCRSRPVTIDGQTFEQIVFDGEAVMQEAGAPALPKVARSVIIPEAATVAVRVTSADYYELRSADCAI